MYPLFGALAFTGLAVAVLEPRQLAHEARHQPSFIHSRDISNSDSEPCKLLSQIYEDAKVNFETGASVVVAVPPSVGVKCLKSVPVDKKRDLELIDYLLPFVSFQSTLEVLADPPEEYLFDGVDVLGGIEVIRDNLKENKYNNQYEVMVDLRSLFAASNDNHFDYPPALLNQWFYFRPGLEFISLSRDGLHLPKIFMISDVIRGNKGGLDYHPSAVQSIDGTPIFDWLEQDAVYNVNNYQDPDAQFNNLFTSIPRAAARMAGTTVISSFEIPDNYTIQFYNGSRQVIENQIAFMPTTDFSGIDSGETFQKTFEHVSAKSKPTNDNERRSDNAGQTADTKIPGFPEPVVKHSMNSIAGYFLAGNYSDTAVLSLLSFLPVGLDMDQLRKLDLTKFILESQNVVVNLVKQAQKEKRDKLIIDLSANGGGSVVLAQLIYTLLFPDGEFTGWDRYRANDALKAAAEADYEQLVKLVITQSDYYPLDLENMPIKTGKEWFGPYTTKSGLNGTAAFQSSKSIPWDPTIPAYLNGYDTTYKPVIPEAPFKPENIVIITDGTCASACGILTGLLTRNHGIRTIAMGGRPLNHAMQAMGGVKGTLLNFNSDLVTVSGQIITSAKDNKKALAIISEAQDAFPGVGTAPLMPIMDSPSAGRVNTLNGFTSDDLGGYPVHFRYEAANCRLFYTQRMAADPSEVWWHASAIAWEDAPCVSGSTYNDDDTISDETLKYDEGVRSQAKAIPGPGSLRKK